MMDASAYTPMAMKNTAMYPTLVVLAVIAMMYPAKASAGRLRGRVGQGGIPMIEKGRQIRTKGPLHFHRSLKIATTTESSNEVSRVYPWKDSRGDVPVITAAGT